MRHGSEYLARRLLATPRRPVPTLSHAYRWSSTSTAPGASPILERQWSTPLAKTIAAAIEVTGPISIAAYMRQCLTSPQGGYYTTPPSTASDSIVANAVDQFGKRGDFITSPEISQVFGELVGIWFLTEWLAQGRRKSGVHFIELGPGRGTLMNDMLRTISQFKAFAGAIEAVWMVETGEGLREKQKTLLCGEAAELKEVKGDGNGEWESISKYAGIPVRWVEDVVLLPADAGKEKMPFIVAHEFFDALPIHAFESVAPVTEQEISQLLDQGGSPVVRRSGASRTPQWRELLVTPTKHKFSLQQTENRTPNINAPDFQLTLAKASTPESLIMPQLPRYRKLKDQAGSRVEVSPESFRYIDDIAKRIGGLGSNSSGKQSGAALIVDYGPLDTVPINSLRGIKAHQIISPFAHPGEADVSADVDFTALADAAIDASDGVEVYGPVEQGTWLRQLGIEARVGQLLKNVPDEEKRKGIDSGWKRLVDGGPRGMGKAYKCMAILPESKGQRRPVGFGGGVADDKRDPARHEMKLV